jgi:hypothetical protein
MWKRLVIFFLLVIAAFFVVRYFSTESFSLGWVETPALAPPVKQQQPYGSHAVAQGGPSSPAAAPSVAMPPVMSAPPEPKDPYDDTQQSADAPEQMRFPERSFGPGIVPETADLAKAGGIADSPAASAQAFQQFNPEFVSNGGGFFDNISAHEDENPNYSSF